MPWKRITPDTHEVRLPYPAPRQVSEIARHLQRRMAHRHPYADEDRLGEIYSLTVMLASLMKYGLLPDDVDEDGLIFRFDNEIDAYLFQIQQD